MVGGATVSERVVLVPVKGAPVPVLLSVDRTVKVKVPPCVGVPLTVPDELRLKPKGKLPEAREKLP